MSINLFDEGENTPIDLFAPVASQEGYAFPVEHFSPHFTKEPLDEPASIEPEVEIDVEVNPNKPSGSLVDVVETGEIPEHVSLGLENDGITDTPQDPLPATTTPVDRISLEQDLNDLATLNTALSTIRSNGGISRSDVIQIENEYPGLITKQKPLNAFSSVVSVCGYDVSMEGISDRIGDIVDRIIAAIGRLIDRLINVTSTTSLTAILSPSGDTLKARWENLETLTERVAANSGGKLVSERYKDIPAARKSSTLKHFIRLYSVELIKDKVGEIPAGFNFVLSGVAANDLEEINKTLSGIIADVNRSVKSGSVVTFPEVEVTEFRNRYTKKVKGIVPNIEKMVAVEMPNNTITSIRGHIANLNEIKRNITKKKDSIAGDVDVANALKSIASAIMAAESCSSKMDVVLAGYSKYQRVVEMTIDQVTLKVRTF